MYRKSTEVTDSWLARQWHQRCQPARQFQRCEVYRLGAIPPRSLERQLVAPVWLCLYSLGGYGRTTKVFDQPIAVVVRGRANGGVRVQTKAQVAGTVAAIRFGELLEAGSLGLFCGRVNRLAQKCCPPQRGQAGFLFGERVVVTVLPTASGQGLGDA